MSVLRSATGYGARFLRSSPTILTSVPGGSKLRRINTEDRRLGKRERALREIDEKKKKEDRLKEEVKIVDGMQLLYTAPFLNNIVRLKVLFGCHFFPTFA